MNSRSTCFWILIAAALLGAIVITRQVSGPAPAGPAKILPRLDPDSITSVIIRPAGQPEIRADHTNGAWRLVAPRAYPAQELKITNLLHALAELNPAAQITAAELRTRPQARQGFGFDPPQVAIVLLAGATRTDLQAGALTAPGDQVFMQKVGDESLYVVGADLLLKIPRTAVEWRDPSFVQVETRLVNRLSITNQGKVFALQRGSNGAPWRLTAPIPARANDEKIAKALDDLLALRVQEFVADEPEDDLEHHGLQPALLSIDLWQDTNLLAGLQFGRSPSNQTDQVFARNLGLGCLVTVPKDPLAAWSDTLNEYRDPFLLGPTLPPQVVEVRAVETFRLERQGEQGWQISPGGFPVDTGLMKQFLSTLAGLRIVNYIKDVVTAPDLPAYGLDSPAREYILRSGLGTNDPAWQIRFGASQQDTVFAARADENSVYAVPLADVSRLPTAGWLLRERKIWDAPPGEVTRVLVHEGGSVRQLNRNGPHDWSLAAGSQGFINELAVGETVRGICQLSATAWSGTGDELRSRLGFTQKPRKVVVELKDGPPLVLEFGGEAPSTFPYAGVTLDQQFWVFEISWPLYRDIVTYLGLTPEKP